MMSLEVPSSPTLQATAECVIDRVNESGHEEIKLHNKFGELDAISIHSKYLITKKKKLLKVSANFSCRDFTASTASNVCIIQSEGMGKIWDYQPGRITMTSFLCPGRHHGNS